MKAETKTMIAAIYRLVVLLACLGILGMAAWHEYRGETLKAILDLVVVIATRQAL